MKEAKARAAGMSRGSAGDVALVTVGCCKAYCLLTMV
jgi:hypothetical protein